MICSDFDGKILVIPIFLFLCSLRENCFTLVVSCGEVAALSLSRELILHHSSSAAYVLMQEWSTEHVIHFVPSLQSTVNPRMLNWQARRKLSVKICHFFCALNKCRVWGWSQCNQKDNKCSARVILLIPNASVLPQYSGKWVFQRRAKLTIFTMNGKWSSSLLWWKTIVVV
jgi:hypothetical protein